MPTPVSSEIHSDWGDWLPTEVSNAEPDGLAVWYLGCNGMILKSDDGTTAFIDPYFGLGNPPRTVRMIPVPMDPTDVDHADAILITHEHSDHVDGPSQAPLLERTEATYVAPEASLDRVHEEEWRDKWHFESDQLQQISVGDRLELGNLTVDVETAYDPGATHAVTYVIEHPSGTFFHGGDTRHDSETLESIGERYDIDLGVLAFGSVGRIRDTETWERDRTHWYCDETEVVDAANALRLNRLLPSHWDMWKGLTADPSALHPHVRSFEYPRNLEIVEIGDRVDL